MLAIPLALLVIFKYLPIYGVQIAFRDYLPGRSIAESPWVGWKYQFPPFPIRQCTLA